MSWFLSYSSTCWYISSSAFVQDLQKSTSDTFPCRSGFERMPWKRFHTLITTWRPRTVLHVSFNTLHSYVRRCRKMLLPFPQSWLTSESSNTCIRWFCMGTVCTEGEVKGYMCYFFFFFLLASPIVATPHGSPALSPAWGGIPSVFLYHSVCLQLDVKQKQEVMKTSSKQASSASSSFCLKILLLVREFLCYATSQREKQIK